MDVRTNCLIVKHNGAFHHSTGQTCYCTVLVEEQHSHIGSRSSVPKPLHLSSSSRVNTHLCWFWTTQTLEKEKYNSLLFSSLTDCFSLFNACYPTHNEFARMKYVKGRPPGYSMPGQRKIFPSSSMSRSVRSVLCPTHISPPLDRHVLGRLQGSSCCSAH